MPIANYAFESTLVDSKTKSKIFKVSKRISKLLVKDLMKSKGISAINSNSFYVKNYFFNLPINFGYDGKIIKCIFFWNSLIPEEIIIIPDDLHELFVKICLNIEKIFMSVPGINVQNVDFEILPGEDPTHQSIILLSYNYYN